MHKVQRLIPRLLILSAVFSFASCDSAADNPITSTPAFESRQVTPTAGSISSTPLSRSTSTPAVPAPEVLDLTSDPSPTMTPESALKSQATQNTLSPDVASTPHLPPASSPTGSTTPGPTMTETMISPIVVEDPVDRTCPEPAPARPEYYHYFLSGDVWPSPRPELDSHFWFTQPFRGGDRILITEWFPYGYDVGGRYLIHNGMDIAEPLGTPILSAADGTVVVASDDYSALYGWRCDWYGHLVVIETDEQWLGEPVYILFGHVQNIVVEEGQRVARGQEVAEVGVGGAATNPHLHVEVRIGENVFEATRNPLLWFAQPRERGLIAGRLTDPEGRPWQGVAVTAVNRSEDSEDRRTWTYLGDPFLLVNPDEALAENFVFGDLVPGEYELFVTVQGVTYKEDVVVEPSQLSLVEIVTGPFMTPTPSSPTPASVE